MRSQCFFVEFLTHLLHIVSQAKQSKQLLTKEIRLLLEAATYHNLEKNKFANHDIALTSSYRFFLFV